ncbi:MAG: archease [Planctomycetes bacterium]|nr:archease [Planctomycetota bacterium]
MKSFYEFIPHTADIGIRVRGKTLAELFDNAGFALFDVMTSIKQIKPLIQEEITITADNIEELMNYWLSRLLKEYTVNKRLLSAFAIESIDNRQLKAIIKGEDFNPGKHVIQKEIKAVTFHNLSVKETNGGWQAEIIFDV